MSKFAKITCEIVEYEADEETCRRVTAEISGGDIRDPWARLQVHNGVLTPGEIEGLNLAIEGFKRMLSPPGESR